MPKDEVVDHAKFSLGMSMEDFCDACGIPVDCVASFSKEGSASTDDIVNFYKDLKALVPGIVNKNKFVAGCKYYKTLRSSGSSNKSGGTLRQRLGTLGSKLKFGKRRSAIAMGEGQPQAGPVHSSSESTPSATPKSSFHGSNRSNPLDVSSTSSTAVANDQAPEGSETISSLAANTRRPPPTPPDHEDPDAIANDIMAEVDVAPVPGRRSREQLPLPTAIPDGTANGNDWEDGAHDYEDPDDGTYENPDFEKRVNTGNGMPRDYVNSDWMDIADGAQHNYENPDQTYEDPDQINVPETQADVDFIGGTYEDPDAHTSSRPHSSGPVLPGLNGAFQQPSEENARGKMLLAALAQQSQDAVALPENPLDWNSGDLMSYLQDNDLKEFKEVVYSNGFDGAMFIKLSAKQFSAKFSAEECKKLAAALAELRVKSQSAPRKRGSGIDWPQQVVSMASSSSSSANTAPNTSPGESGPDGDGEEVPPPLPSRGKGLTTKPSSKYNTLTRGQTLAPPADGDTRSRNGSVISVGSSESRSRSSSHTTLKIALTSTSSQKARAVHAYTPTARDQLALAKHEIVTILDASAAWWTAQNASGVTGKVPSNYMKMIDDAHLSEAETDTDVAFSDRTAAQDLTQHDSNGDPDWFHADVTSRMDGDRRLRAFNECGCFLVRPSASDPNGRTLSVLETENAVINLRIVNNDDGTCNLLGNSLRHESLAALIDHHKSTPIKFHNKPPVQLTTPCPKDV